MGSHFDAAYLSAHPCYPNAVAWSDENLLAVATGHIVTIMNPSSLSGPRGLVTIQSKPPFQLGLVEKQDLLTPCLISTCLSRDVRPCVRSISWSHQGLAPNSGCLLSVCTVDGFVKLYRAPFCDFRAEWIEVSDISDKLYNYYLDNNFRELHNGPTKYFHKIEEHHTPVPATNVVKEHGFKKKLKQKTSKKSIAKSDLKVVSCNPRNGTKVKHVLDADANGVSNHLEDSRSSATVYGESILIPCLFPEGASVEVLKHSACQKFWLKGKVLCVEEGNILVRFTEDNTENFDEWFLLNLEPAMGEEDDLLLKIRPTLSLGNLPNEIYLAERNTEMEQVLMKGQAVEAWFNNRWSEGVFLGFNGDGLLIDFPGDCGSVTLMPDNVRLMPKWVSDQKSWLITIVKMKIMETFVHQVHQNKHKEDAKGLQEENGCETSVSADQYAYRSNLLQSLVVSWSPALHLSAEDGATSTSSSSKTCALLAVGGKSGKISFWSLNEPQCYTIDHCPVSIETVLVGLLQAHSSWVTAISWVVLESASKFVLATGSCEGCVKLWLGDIEGFFSSKEANDDCLCLLREVAAVTAVPVSVISCILPSKFHDEILVAVGKGSGSLEVVSCDMSSREIKFAGEFHAHDQVVTGISWAFDGYCIYSCSQDNSVRCWRLEMNSISLVPFPLNCLAHGRNTFNEIPRHIFDSCFGLALSPGGLVLALVHDIDMGLVDPMYEFRSQKAAIELIWAGGMVKVSKEVFPCGYCEAVPGFSENDVVCWESCILWSLEQFQCATKPLVLWDIVEALLAFKQVEPKYVETILYNWLLVSWTDANSTVSLENILSSAPSVFCKISSRFIHMVVIICRRLVLSPLNTNASNVGRHELFPLNDETLSLWSNLLTNGEAELRSRLVALTFSAVLSLASGTSTAISLDRRCWFPTGVAQMQQWAVLNYSLVPDDLKLLKMKVDHLGKRIYSLCEYVSEEKCNFCNSSVPFESPDMAVCDGSEYANVVGEKHKLHRCAASMQVCDSSPSWLCVCCRRYVYKLAPASLFTVGSSDYFNHVTVSSFLRTYPKPCCPFCGILLQRLQPEFLLSASLV